MDYTYIYTLGKSNDHWIATTKSKSQRRIIALIIIMLFLFKPQDARWKGVVDQVAKVLEVVALGIWESRSGPEAG